MAALATARDVARRRTILALKARAQGHARRIPFHDLPEEERFERLSTQRKHFIDTIKIIAYRAETAMAQTLRERWPAARAERPLSQGSNAGAPPLACTQYTKDMKNIY